MSSQRNPYYSRTDERELNIPEDEWKRLLDPEVYEVARRKGTEMPFAGKYWASSPQGTYYCAVCGNALFRSDSKFASQCGWPSFFEPLSAQSVRYMRDTSYGMIRTEVLCGRCGSHLGHVFEVGSRPLRQHYCMNSIVLDFEPSSDEMISSAQ